MRRAPCQAIILRDGDPNVLAHAVFVNGRGRVSQENCPRSGGIEQFRMVCIGAILGCAIVDKNILCVVDL